MVDDTRQGDMITYVVIGSLHYSQDLKVFFHTGLNKKKVVRHSISLKYKNGTFISNRYLTLETFISYNLFCLKRRFCKYLVVFQKKTCEF